MRFTRLLCALLCLLASPIVLAEIPGQADLSGLTQGKYKAALQEFHQRTMLQTYDTAGLKDPKWDDAARRLIVEFSKYFAYANANYYYPAPPRLDAAELEALAHVAIDAGCQDPQILDLYGISLLDQRRIDDATAAMLRAESAMLEHKQSSLRRLFNARRILRIVGADARDPASVRRRQRIEEDRIDALAEAGKEGMDRRLVFEAVTEDFDDMSSARLQPIYDAMVAKGVDPWFVQMTAGYLHIKRAWDARGSGYGYTVTEEGGRRFEEELNAAEAALRMAYELHPEYPEAATKMITVRMGLNEAPGNTLRDWFNRAAAAQIDYWPAYSNFLYGMLPRWQGSYAQLMDFGMEAAQTRRYDTIVPWVLADVVDRIHADDDGSWRHLSQPGVIEALDEMSRGYAKQLPALSYHRARFAGYAWKVRRYDLGLAAIKDDAGFDAPIAETGEIPARVVSGTSILASPSGEALLNAETLAAAGQLDAAIAGYEAVAAKTAPDDKGMPWLRSRLQEFAWRKTFNTNQPVSIMPNKTLDAWWVMDGKLSSDGTKAHMVANADYNDVYCAADFGRRFELTARFAIEDHKDPDNGAGLLIGWHGQGRLNLAALCPGEKPTLLFGADSSNRVDQLPCPWMRGETNTLTIRCWDDFLQVMINGRDVDIPGGLLRPVTGERSAIGFFAAASESDPITFDMTELQVQRLTREPIKLSSSRLNDRANP
jgi:hypothetical protein